VQEYLGFPFDEQAGWKLYGELSNRRTEIEAELQEVFLPWREETEFIPKVNNKKLGYVKGEPFIKVKETVFNPCSREHIARALRERYDWKPDEFTETGLAKVDETVLSALEYPEAKLLSEYLMLQKRLGQLGEGKQAWLKLVKKGRIHGRVNHMGTHTSRCTHSNPNTGQIPSTGATYGSACRSLFIAPDGYRIIGCDVSGLELRALAHYMALYDGGAYADEILTGDIHTTNMEAAGLPSRATAKTFIYGFLYGGGDEKIGSIVGKDAKAGRRLKAQFLKKTPALAKLRDNVSKAAENRGYLKVLDGRKVPVRHKHASLNTLLQSTGAIICKRWLVEFHRKMQAEGFVLGEDYYQAAFVHDELQIIAKKSITERVGALCVEAIKDAGEAYNFRLRLDGEYNVGKNWAETH
jgi:DNA polymerase I-like protein with 3'-5' exonuclease and polymerase domains